MTEPTELYDDGKLHVWRESRDSWLGRIVSTGEEKRHPRKARVLAWYRRRQRILDRGNEPPEEHDCGRLLLWRAGPTRWRAQRVATGEERTFTKRYHAEQWHDLEESTERKQRAGMYDAKTTWNEVTGKCIYKPKPELLALQRAFLTSKW